ncbi:hypothetical protein [Caulobacter segnis]|uniref:Uncharacterized protein n=1 Tax=Caulobacter segnis TaxID=88688 RepID=A0A2W5V349_9CAUL|nr:hypothetical protein [Caulobacter segnis]PZR34240.1 MAG: hypothetical protein DI526_11070 [Caulobacter segnis]
MSFALKLAREVKTSAQVFGSAIIAVALLGATVSTIANLQPESWQNILAWFSRAGIAPALCAYLGGLFFAGVLMRMSTEGRRASVELRTLNSIRALEGRLDTLRDKARDHEAADLALVAREDLIIRLQSIEAATIMEMLVEGAVRKEAESDVIRRVFGEAIATSPKADQLSDIFGQIKKIASDAPATPS